VTDVDRHLLGPQLQQLSPGDRRGIISAARGDSSGQEAG
jgi:hypothetical protein